MGLYCLFFLFSDTFFEGKVKHFFFPMQRYNTYFRKKSKSMKKKFPSYKTMENKRKKFGFSRK